MLERVQTVLDRIRPALQMDGGDIELVSVEPGGVVKIRLQGACVTCPSLAMTLQHGIERALRDALPDVTRVVNVTLDEAA